MSAWERPSSIYPCWLAREWRARRPSTLHIPVKTTAPDVHLNQDWKGSCASRSEMSKLRRWFIFDLDYGGVAGRGQRVMQIFNGTCVTVKAISRLSLGLGLLANLSVHKVDSKRPLKPRLAEVEAKPSRSERSLKVEIVGAERTRCSSGVTYGAKPFWNKHLYLVLFRRGAKSRPLGVVRASEKVKTNAQKTDWLDVVVCSGRSYLSFFSFIIMCGRLQGSLKFLLKESGRIFATSAGQVWGLKEANQQIPPAADAMSPK